MAKGFAFLEELLSKKGLTHTDLSNFLKVTPQAMQGWKNSDRIPTRRVAQIADYFNLGSMDVDRLLGLAPLRVEFRTKRGEHLDDVDVSEQIKVRAQVIFERFFDNNHKRLTHDLSSLRAQIHTSDKNFTKIAKCIRDEFTIPDYRPLGADDLFALQTRIGVRSLYLPFRQIGLNTNRPGDDRGQTAVLYSRDSSCSVLIDSDRTVDEAHFDKAHEMLHVIFGEIFEHSVDLERLIDQVSGELVYPKRFIIEQFFDNDPSSKPIKNKELLGARFYELTRSLRHILSPRGVARAMRDTELTSKSSELFHFFFSELHADFRKHSVTYSSYGNMNFDFSNREKLASFYKDVVERTENEGFYPLFVKLKRDLMSDTLQPSDFADTFGLSYADALVLKAIWDNDKSE